MESRVFTFVIALFSKIALWFDKSVIGRIYNKLCQKCYKEFSESKLGAFFIKETKKSGIFSGSLLGKLCGLPEKLLFYFRRVLGGMLNRMTETSRICLTVNSWADISIRFYGIVLLVFSTVMLFFSFSSVVALVAYGVMAFLAFVCILINKSIRQIFDGSFLMSSFIQMFLYENTKEHTVIKLDAKKGFTALTCGIILSFLCIAMDEKMFALLVIGVAAFVFLLKYLRLGVFLTVIFSPMLPTMALVGLSILCAVVFCIHVVMDENFTFAKNALGGFIIFFILALLWGCVNSFSFMSSVPQVMVHISFLLFYFILVNTIRTKEQWIAMIKLFLLSAFVVAAYGVFQNFFGVDSKESWIDENMFQNIEVRVYSFFNNPNVLGEFLVMTIPVTLAVIWGKMRDVYKAFFIGVLLVMLACLVFTWSRGAWLGVVLACAIFLAIMDRRWVFLGILALMSLPLVLVVTNNTAILERFLSIGNTADTSTAYRVAIWQASIGIIRDFWISGIGIGSESFKTVYPMYQVSGAEFALHSHNLYLQICVEMGIIGIASFLSLVLMFIRQTFSAKITTLRKKDPMAKIVIGLGAGVIGFLFQGLTDYVWYNYKILMIFWIMIALTISGVNMIRDTSQNEEVSL